jgi:hypothetical protein
MRDVEGALVDVLSTQENHERDREILATRARMAERRRLLSGAEIRALAQASRDNTAYIGDYPPFPWILASDHPPVVTSDSPRMPPVPESGDFSSSRANRGILPGHARRGGRRPAWSERRLGERPSPPSRVPSSDQVSGQSPPLPSLTPDFSPARRYTLEDPWSRESETASRMFAESTGTVSLLFYNTIM